MYRCYDCGKKASESAADCPNCGAALHLLCECGTSFPQSAEACPACGMTHTPRRYGWRPGPRFLLALVVLLGVAGWLAVKYYPRDPETQRQDAWEKITYEFDQGRHTSARAMLSDYLEQNPKDANALYHRGLCDHLKAGRHPEAGLADIRAAHELDRKLSGASLFLARHALWAKDDKSAIRLALLALEGASPPPEAHVIIGELHQKRGDLDRAIYRLARAFDMGRYSFEQPEPGQSPWEDLVRSLAELYALRTEWRDLAPRQVRRTDVGRELDRLALSGHNAAECRLVAAKLAYAREDYPAAMGYIGRSNNTTVASIDARLLDGMTKWKRGNQTGAQVQFDEVRKNTKTAPPLLELARFLREEGDPEYAGEVLAEAEARFPHEPGAALLSAEIAVAESKAAEAKRILQTALAKHPDDPNLRLLLAKVLLGMGKSVDEPEEILRELVRDPRVARRAGLLLAGALSRVPEDSARMSEAERLLTDTSDEAYAPPSILLERRFLLGRLKFLRGRFADAIDSLSKVTSSRPERTDAHILLARCHMELGEEDDVGVELSDALGHLRKKLDGILERAVSGRRPDPRTLADAQTDLDAAIGLLPAEGDQTEQRSAAETLIRLTLVHHATGNGAAARESLERAAEILPEISKGESYQTAEEKLGK